MIEKAFAFGAFMSVPFILFFTFAVGFICGCSPMIRNKIIAELKSELSTKETE